MQCNRYFKIIDKLSRQFIKSQLRFLKVCLHEKVRAKERILSMIDSQVGENFLKKHFRRQRLLS